MFIFCGVFCLALSFAVVTTAVVFTRRTGAPNAVMYAGACLSVSAMQLGCSFLAPSARGLEGAVLCAVGSLLAGVAFAFSAIRQSPNR